MRQNRALSIVAAKHTTMPVIMVAIETSPAKGRILTNQNLEPFRHRTVGTTTECCKFQHVCLNSLEHHSKGNDWRLWLAYSIKTFQYRWARASMAQIPDPNSQTVHGDIHVPTRSERSCGGFLSHGNIIHGDNWWLLKQPWWRLGDQAMRQVTHIVPHLEGIRIDLVPRAM